MIGTGEKKVCFLNGHAIKVHKETDYAFRGTGTTSLLELPEGLLLLLLIV